MGGVKLGSLLLQFFLRVKLAVGHRLRRRGNKALALDRGGGCGTGQEWGFWLKFEDGFWATPFFGQTGSPRLPPPNLTTPNAGISAKKHLPNRDLYCGCYFSTRLNKLLLFGFRIELFADFRAFLPFSDFLYSPLRRGEPSIPPPHG